MQTIQFKRATRAQINAAATAGNLNAGEPYVITDEGRMAIGESASAYTAFLKDGEGGAASGTVATPSNATPANNAVDVVPPLVIAASAFSSTGAAPHSTSQYQLSTVNNFALPDYDSGEIAAASSYTLASGIVGMGESVYWRIRFKDALGGWSAWSVPTKFEARGASIVTKPANTLPANGATDTKRSTPLTASAFASTQSATHQATRVQISSSSDFVSLRLDVTLGGVTSYVIPKASWVLGAAEYWRVQYQNSVGVWSEWSDATSYTTTSVADVAATGGTITQDGAYNIHTFTTTGTFVSDDAITADVLVVAGGGGGGGSYAAGGGGGGGVIYKTALAVAAGTYTVTVGAGAPTTAAAAPQGAKGGNSSFAPAGTATGGGGGSAYSGPGGGNGGSGGGSSYSATGGGGTAVAGQGYAGGGVSASGVGASGGGGGGAGNETTGTGGIGFACSISPAATRYAGGGGRGSQGAGYGAAGAGGAGGGGAGSLGNGAAGAANTGGGGGGAGYSENTGGAGGKGIVIIRYLR